MQAPRHVSQLTEETCFHKVASMSSEGSEQVLGLLKELSVYKALDEDYRAGPRGRVETQAYGERDRRRLEIKQEMQELAAESKSHPS